MRFMPWIAVETFPMYQLKVASTHGRDGQENNPLIPLGSGSRRRPDATRQIGSGLDTTRAPGALVVAQEENSQFPVC